MRVYTLLFSIVTHVAVVLGVVVTTLVATDTLPEVRRAIDYIAVSAPAVPSPPPVRRAPRPSAVTPAPSFPVEAPEGISEEAPVPPPLPDESMAGTVVPDGIGIPGGTFLDSPPPSPPPQPVRVGGAIEPPRRLRHVLPIYPPLARAAQVEGVVILEAVIAEDGTVRDVRTLRSIPLLDASAIEAVRQWRFTPTRLNGAPVSVVMTVTVAFTLR